MSRRSGARSQASGSGAEQLTLDVEGLLSGEPSGPAARGPASRRSTRPPGGRPDGRRSGRDQPGEPADGQPGGEPAAGGSGEPVRARLGGPAGAGPAGAGGGRDGRPGAGVVAERTRSPLSAIRIAAALGRPAPTAEQAAVIEAPVGPLLVVAGAGSGKTETMAARVVWLVANGVVAPEEILGLTFTRKAAAELADRIRARLRALHRRGLCPLPQPVTVSTYHAYAAALLGDHGLRLGVEPGARVLGEAGSWQLVDELVQRWDGDMDGVEAVRGTVVDAVLALAGECAEHLLAAADVDAVLAEVVERVVELPAEVGDGVPGRPSRPVRDVLTRLDARRRLIPLVEAYLRRKRELGVLDFGDQVALAARLARDVPEVGATERERYRVVLLDEYQDTSHAQLVMLTALFGSGHPVTAVGDPHQSIYGWRGASAGNLERFPRDFPSDPGQPAPVAQLSTSWRNDRAVLRVANRVSGPLRRPPSWGGSAARVEVRDLIARPDAGPGAVQVQWHATVEDEAAAVAELAAWAWRQQRPSIAVLCRTRAQFPLVEAALRARGLPVEVVGLGGLLHVPEVADLRAALEVLHDPTRGDSLVRLLTGAAWQLGAPDLDALGAWAKALVRRVLGGRRPGDGGRADPGAALDAAEERSIVEALDDLPEPEWRGPNGEELSAEGRRRLTRLAEVLRGLRSRTGLALPDLVLEVERALLLDVEVAARPGHRPAAARAHLDAFVDVAAGFADSGDRPTLGAFLGWLAAAERRENGLDAGLVEQREDAVQVLTVHAAKGLEWDLVAVTGLVEGTFPAGHGGRPVIRSNGWLQDWGAVPYPCRGDADALPQWPVRAAASQRELTDSLDEFRTRCAEHEVGEERRLAYVAVTRARHRLLLTGAAWGDGSLPRQPSRFLAEVAQLAEEPGAGVSLGTWAQDPDEGTANPRETLRATYAWPVDPLGERRAAVEEGAALVRAALAELAEAGTETGTETGAETEVGAEVGAETEVGADTEAETEVGAETEDRAAPVRAALPEEALPEEVLPEEALPEPGGTLSWQREVDLLLAERDAGRRSRLVVDLPAHLSASRVVALAADPQALALRLRRPMPEPPSPHARRGSAFHAWLEQRFAAAALVDVDELPGAADDAGADQELATLQETFLASEWAGRMPEAVEVAVETPVAGLVIRGRIDAVFRLDPAAAAESRWDVVDWKTGSPPRRAEDARARAVQLAVYRLAWARLQGVDVDRVGAAFYYASTGQTVRPVDLLDADELAALIRAATTDPAATADPAASTEPEAGHEPDRSTEPDGAA